MFNLQVYTLNLAAGQEQPDLPGVLAVAPPRRTGRNRNQDLLVVYLKLEGQVPFTPAQHNELLEKLAAIFYRTSGSVTAAMRATAASLNDFLLARNLRSTREGGQVVAILNLAVLHGDLVYMAHSGPTQSFVLGHEEVQVNRDPQMGRGLGLSRNPPIRFFQARVKVGDIVLLSHLPPPTWKPEAFTGSPKLGLEGLRRRLFNQAGSDLQAVLVRVQSGKGEISRAALPGRQWPEREAAPALPISAEAEDPPTQEGDGETTAQPIEVPVEMDPTVESSPPEQTETVETDQAQENEPPATVEEETQPQVVEPVVEPQAKRSTGLLARFERMRQERAARTHEIEESPSSDGDEQERSAEPNGARPQGVYITGEQLVEPAAPVRQVQTPVRRRAGRFEEEPAEPVTVAAETAKQPPVRPVERANIWKPLAARTRAFFGRMRFTLAKAWLGGDAAQQKIGSFGRKAIARMTPTREEPAKLSPGTLFFLAVAVPLIISAVAATMYIRNGYSEQHLIYLTQAQQYADLAANQPDPVLKRNNLDQSLQFLNQADEYGQTNESISLRAQVQQALDILEGVRRLEVVPAAPTPFDSDVNVVRMVAGPGEDIYVLDGNKGRILRLIYKRPGYEIDPQFICGPGQVGVEGLIVSPLIDIAPVRSGHNSGPTVMGIDNAGNMLYCGPNRNPEATMLTPPDSGWPSLSNITLADRVLYVLDTKANGVWRYTGDGEVFSGAPRLFFDNEIPYLADVIDLAVYQDDLFLLHGDGTMTKCTFSGFDFSPTRCTMQMDYNLQRDGRSQTALAALESPVIQMQTTDSPAYSLFLFSTEGPTLYHFSLALNLQYQYRPRLQGTYELPNREATAFLITANRRMLIAFGNEVFYTELIP